MKDAVRELNAKGGLPTARNRANDFPWFTEADSMRVFLATLGTETNTFSFFPTGIEDFKDGSGARAISRRSRLALVGAGADWSRARAGGLGGDREPLRLRRPGGPTTRAAYESMRDRILDDLRAAGRSMRC